MAVPQVQQCVSCSSALGADAKFCPTCGTKVEAQPAKFCPQCGTPQDGDHTFCPSCGAATAGAPPAPQWSVALPPPGDIQITPFGAILAGWWRRVGANALDSFICAIPAIICFVAAVASGTDTDGDGVVDKFNNTWVAIALVVGFLVPAIYFTLLTTLGRGQTVGQIAAGISVRDAMIGEKLGLGRSLLRWFVRTALYAALGLPGMLSDLWPLWDGQHQTLADKSCRSVVVRRV